MSKGQLALVLHAHLPYVRSENPTSLEADWYFQALIECYLPLLELLEESHAAEDQFPHMTLGISPTLLSLLADKELQERFQPWVLLRLDLLKEAPPQLYNAANHLSKRIKKQLLHWQSINGDLISRFSFLQKEGVLDLLTCAATHGYLPLLREHPEAVRAQLLTAVREHSRLIGSPPLGIWLPECAYYEGLDKLMYEVGLRYAVLDGHGLLNANPRPRYGIYAPICSTKGVAFFGRDAESTFPVWSSREGYPGDSSYREFHRDLGWDFPKEKLQEIGINEPRPLGLKLYRVTGVSTPLENKAPYEPDLASSLVKDHARDYLQGRKSQLKQLKTSMVVNPLLVAPFDAELFGHWWFEGPEFLSELFRQAPRENISFTRLVDSLSNSPRLQLSDPSPSSWGQGGYHHYWLNETNAWVIPEWSKAGKAMIECCDRFNGIGGEKDRLLRQAARELLLAQSSDWSFILRAGTTTQIAKERIHRHLQRFWSLVNAANDKEDLSDSLLLRFENEDCLFPFVDPRDWTPMRN
ncbi:glycoside hydrolase family 57 protein [Prochlorococcus sp. MIT 1341]|uniref:glycoside hydrolase family 57 protein n=1 Tax=Prochlorococcus sp. MIT 1341 TaxID=3096221 RepID=UPI002A75CCDC|nr:1,4-alpha-glucan branching protein domain-containing protein [Prochlorococcus sp. MIT 1341]